MLLNFCFWQTNAALVLRTLPCGHNVSTDATALAILHKYFLRATMLLHDVSFPRRQALTEAEAALDADRHPLPESESLTANFVSAPGFECEVTNLHPACDAAKPKADQHPCLDDSARGVGLAASAPAAAVVDTAGSTSKPPNICSVLGGSHLIRPPPAIQTSDADWSRTGLPLAADSHVVGGVARPQDTERLDSDSGHGEGGDGAYCDYSSGGDNIDAATAVSPADDASEESRSPREHILLWRKRRRRIVSGFYSELLFPFASGDRALPPPFPAPVPLLEEAPDQQGNALCRLELR